MKNRFNPFITFSLLLLDLLLLNSCFVYAHLAHFQFNSVVFTPEFIGFVLYINFIWISIAFSFRLYNSHRMEKIKKILIPSLISIVLFFFSFLLYFQFVEFNYLNRDAVKNYFVVFAVVMIVLKSIEHLSLPYFIRLINKPHNAIIVGYSQSAKELRYFFEKDPWSNYRFLGYFTDNEKRNEQIIGNFIEIKNYIEKEKVDDVFLLLNHIPKELQKEVANITKNQSTNIHLVPELSTFAMMNVSYTEFGHQPVLNVERGPLSKLHNQLIKRAIDIFISTIIILSLLTWIIPILWLINKLIYRQGVFFVQARNGLNNQQFRCIKFRSMFDNPLADKKEAGMGDDRVTPLGKFLRKTSIDELPQFINVFKGEMSVVGPRPHMLRHTSLYRKTLKEFMVRHTVKPGLTGLAQVSGFRGSIFNEKHLRNRVKMDIKYIETWTIWMDIKIMLLTILRIFKGDKNAF